MREKAPRVGTMVAIELPRGVRWDAAGKFVYLFFLSALIAAWAAARRAIGTRNGEQLT